MRKWLCWGLFPVTAWANTTNTGSGSAISNGELLRVMLGLLLVVGVIVFLSWLLRRLNSAGLGNTNGFRVIASMSLGTREKIMLINTGNRFLLLGVTTGSINTLHDFGEELPAGFLSDNKTSFTEFLKTALGKS
ncbi:flagellar biosynthetic protein FliO [Legionella hackeliae]|uniref:Flagellar protein n=1 Tax=Legionella hackeliae TaxID=449 RepID=A0A0A8UUU1_LEGHA|nr:flagellar biosynthetic protein FliO [Legionella hackeliae]KTD15353.1 flagellar protein fliO [Legionella hackeliae]CEK11281.1 Flagellar assembly protein FliO [Legionella hackeliae]STX48049.1 flagellar assembly protein FliO [Legionella hackeliae]